MEKRYCDRCGEMMPLYSRICPICYSREHFSAVTKSHDTPVDYLERMREYLVEMLSIPKLSIWQMVGSVIRNGHYDPYRVQILQVKESFDVVHALVELHFAEHDDVLEAAIMMRDMLYDEIETRMSLSSLHIFNSNDDK